MCDDLSNFVNWEAWGGPVTKVRWCYGSFVKVSLNPKWARELDIGDGDRAELCMHKAFADSLLVIKAPFRGRNGYKVRANTAFSAVTIQKTCKKQFVEFFFHRYNRKVIMPDTVEVVTLEPNVKAIALRCPEVEEYLGIRKEQESMESMTSPPTFGVEASPTPNNTVGTLVVNHAMADDECGVDGESKVPVSS